jgi:hypothetical protein
MTRADPSAGFAARNANRLGPANEGNGGETMGPKAPPAEIVSQIENRCATLGQRG